MKDKVLERLTMSLDFILFFVILICGVCFWDIKSLFDSNSWILNLLSIAFPAGILHILNQYVLSPLIYFLTIYIKHNIGRNIYYKKHYKAVISKAVNWLVSCNVHWGIENRSATEQNVNTCEGLLAIRAAGLQQEKSAIYKKAFQTVLSNMTDGGLPSKSLQRPTVVCTSMLLDLVAKERDNPCGILIDYDRFEKIACTLWNARSQKSGWGIYITKAKENECSLANTYWALRALSQYEVGKSDEFREYLKLIYQHSYQSTFGFHHSDSPRLITTAMYLNLYYCIDSTLQNALAVTYDPKKALEFVYDSFVTNNVQIENETLYGVKVDKTPGPIKAPWQHITVGYALDVLLTATYNRVLSLPKRNLLFIKINKLIRNDVKSDGAGRCYYLPQNIEHCNTGIFTYPTAYFVLGLGRINIF